MSAEARIENPKITVETAAVERGRTVIAGTTVVAGTTVSISGTSFSTKSDARRGFRFELAWLPPTCIAQLTVGSQVYPVVVANCAPGRPLKAGSFSGATAAVKSSNWTFAIGGAPTSFAVGDTVVVSASFVASPLTSAIPYPSTPKPTNQAYDVTVCLKRANGSLLIYDILSTTADVDTPIAVASVNQQVVIDSAGTHQIGLCFRSGGVNGISATDIIGYWIALS
jgi:hypothetical protein